MTAPTWYVRIAVTVAAATEVDGQSTMSSWPTRWANVILSNKACAASSAGSVLGAGAEVVAGLDAEVDDAVDAVREVLAAGWPAVVAPQAASTSAAAAAAARRRCISQTSSR